MTVGKASRVQGCIEHRLGAIGRIESYVQGLDLASLSRSTLVQDAVIRNFEIIGEAANKIQAVDRRRRDLKTGAVRTLNLLLITDFIRTAKKEGRSYRGAPFEYQSGSTECSALLARLAAWPPKSTPPI